MLWQVGFRKRLLSEVAGFTVDARSFRLDWEANGPMVPGLDPMAAQERLQKFQQTFEVVSEWAAPLSALNPKP